MVAQLLLRSSWRFHRQHPLQLLLSMFGIILGVGIVTSVLITNHSAIRAFALSSEALYGRATHQIVAANGIEDKQAAQFIQTQPNLTIAPVIEAETTLNNELVTLIGLDPFREAQFARLQNSDNTNSATGSNNVFNLSSILGNKHPIWVSDATAQRLQLTIGQTVVIGENEAVIAGLFGTSSRAASDGLIVTDISVAQMLANRLGTIDRLELLADDNAIANISPSLPPQWRLQTTAQRQSTMQAMTKGFQINLTAMSLLALLVGMFLIHNTMTFAVLQRREVFATKRLVGISAKGLFTLVIAEALIFSAVASIIGLAAGIFIAHKLLQLTTQTINDLYFVLHVQQIHLSPWVLLAGLLLGIGSSVVAATLAAKEAASENAIQARRRSAIEERTSKLLPWLLILGVAIFLIGIALAYLPSQSLVLGFAALMIIIMGYGLCIPRLSQWLLNAIRQLFGRFNVAISLALGSLTSNMSRTGLAIAALSVAVSATLGVDIMIGSFRQSVDDWLKQTLQSDMYITLGDTDGTGKSTASNVSTPWLQTLSNLDGVKEVSTGIIAETVTNFDTFDMLVLLPSAVSEASYEWLHNNSEGTWQRFLDEPSVLISEPLANKYNLTKGSSITLFTERIGDKAFDIAGVYKDYGSSHGRMVIHRKHYDQFWDNANVGSIGISTTSGADMNTVLERVRAHTKLLPIPSRVRDNVSIHQESLRIFDRTFAVTRVLRWLTMGVAFIGIFSALLAMHLERAKDFAVLKASGASDNQLKSIIALQSLGMGITAGLLAVPLGWIMSEILIHIINVRSFGWSMSSLIPKDSIPQTLLLAVGSAVLACIYPAWKVGRQSLVSELRSE